MKFFKTFYTLFTLYTLSIFYTFFTLSSCTFTKRISKQANRVLLKDSAIKQGHIGISIYEPATGKYWYNYDAEKYFIPASNTKLFTLYAGMKYLGDSLVGLRYEIVNDTVADIYPTGDPTLLHIDFTKQPVLDFLKKQHTIIINRSYRSFKSLGHGWAWDDHQENYMIPRVQFPMFENLLKIKWINKDSIIVYPKYFSKKTVEATDLSEGFQLIKEFGENNFTLLNGNTKRITSPFESDTDADINLLSDTLNNNNIFYSNGIHPHDNKKLKVIHSQPTDSLFKPMMHNSDNFFAEQTLLMASNEHLGYMSDVDMIDTLLKNDLKDVPQKPKWVDGSGLSRYNLFTPKDFVYILDKIKNEFSVARIENILPTGGTGTLSDYYKKDSSFIYAKTGTLSNNCALSGYLITKKNKQLIFSVLVNNYQTPAAPVRRAVEKLLQSIRENY